MYDLTLVPYIVKTELFGPESEKLRVAAELGRLRVPENRGNPSSHMIELAFIRLKSTAEHPGPPLLFLAGGPGVPGTDAMRFERMLSWFLELRGICDVIALDQRGTGMSVPRFDCLERWDLPLDQPGDRDEYLRIMRERCRAGAAFWQERGADLAGYTTVESADDIDALRQALGYEQISLYGASYGSHLALATLRRHAPHIARAIVALVEGPDHTIKLPGNVQRHVEHIARLTQADPWLNVKIPDLLNLMRTVLERLAREPASVIVTDEKSGAAQNVVIGKFDAQFLTASGMGDRKFISQLPARYYAMTHGDFSWLASEAQRWRRDWMGNAMSYVMDCASGLSGERRARIQHEAPETLLGDVIDFPFPDICDAWGCPDLGPAYRAPITSDVPTLFITGTLDGRTPTSNLDDIRPGFSQSHHILVEGAGHSTPTLVAIPAIRAATITFLRGEPLTVTRASIPFEFAPLE